MTTSAAMQQVTSETSLQSDSNREATLSQVRTQSKESGSGNGAQSGITKTGGAPLGILDALYFGKPKRRHIEEFGCIFAILFCIIAGVRAYNGSVDRALPMVVAAGGLVGLSYAVPIVVYPFWSAWMTFAHYLGIVMSFVFVLVTWTVIATPLALILRVIGKEVMDLSYRADVETYWEDRPQKLHDFRLLERQF
ncbi:MAG: hypothetical protein KDD60_05920 [Bdellovibrionales bacterium]|nr:hypothetical protein [Bdellovibrionales bacterium]